MKKKTRININTSFKIYLKVLLSFINNKYPPKKKFENDLKNFFLTENLLLTSQGRVAAFNIFKVILTSKKNEILISPYTLTEVINAIKYAGGKPVYVEIDIKKGLPLEKDLDKKINENTAGLVITHLYSNKEDILNFKYKYEQKIKIVEDVAINFGAKIDQYNFLGTIFDYSFFSFGVMKNLCTFHGGVIFAKDKSKLFEIEQNLNKNIKYPTFDSLKLLFFCILIDFFYSKYIYNFFTHYILSIPLKKLDQLMYPGVYPKFFKKIPKYYNYCFQENFSIAGIQNLKKLDSRHIRKIEKVKIYEKYLDKNLKINNYNFYEVNSFLEYPVLLKKNNNKFLSKELLKIGYDVRHTWYINNSRYLNLNNTESFPNCEYLHEKILSLPTHDKILEKDVIKICQLINFYEKSNI